MKKIALFLLLAFNFNNKFYAQENWKTEPMDVTETDPRIGTLENKTLGIVTNSQKRIIIDTNGRVKISKLVGRGLRLVFADSLGNLIVDDNVGNANFEMSVCGSPSNELAFDPLRCSSKPCLTNMIPWHEGGNQIMPLGNNKIGTCSNHDFILKSFGNNLMWLKTTGLVGIGTASPRAKLEVLDDSLNLSVLKLTNNHWACNQTVAMEFWNGVNRNYATSRIVSRMDGCGSEGEALDFETETAGAGVSSVKMTLTNSGKVLIGTQAGATNSSTLSLNANGGDAFEVFDHTNQKINFKVKANGHVFARELRVLAPNLNFPDYVFDKAYKLKPLIEVENFIKENKHLPNIPSANEVSESGINVAELQVKQMEKIEELYLYVIQQQKEIEQLKEQNSKLEKLISEK